MNTSRDYALLQIVIKVLKILAWIALAVGIIGALVALFFASLPGILRLIGLVTALLLGIGWFTQLYALGGVLSVLMEIETHTHLMAEHAPAE